MVEGFMTDWRTWQCQCASSWWA